MVVKLRRIAVLALVLLLPGLLEAQVQSSYVVNGSGASAVNVQDGGNSLTVDGTVTCNAGSGTLAVSGNWLTDAALRASAVPVTCNAGSGTFAVSGSFWPTTAAAPSSTRLSDGAAFYDAAKTGQLPAALDVSGYLKVHEQGTATVSGTVTTTPPANASTNVAQVAGTTTDTNSGLKSAGTQRVVLATDQPQLTNALKVDGSAVTQPVSGSITVAGSTTADTELPAAGALADNTPNPTAPAAGAFLHAWDGANWDRLQTGALTGGALKVDGSAVTQPVSGTVTVTDGAGALNVIVDSSALPSGASTLAEQQTQTTALQIIDNLPLAQGSTTSGQTGPIVQGAVTTAAPSYTTAQTSPLSLTTTGLLRTDGSGVTQPVSGTVTTTPPSNASTNVAQVAGTTTDTNSGTKSAGTLRVVIATDQPALTNKLLVTPDSVALPANQSVNMAQVGGTNTVTGGTAGTVGVAGIQAHDAAISGNNPFLNGGYASAAAPSDVSADGDLVRAWHLRNGSYVANLAAGSTLITSTGSSINVNCTGGCTPGGSFNDSTAFTFGTSAVANMGAVVDEVATNTVAENSAGAPRMNTNRILYVDLSKTVANTNALLVTGTGGTFPVSGTVTTTPPSNASTNVAQVAGTTTDTNSGVKSAGTLRVVIATDQPALTNKLLVTPDSVALPANQSVNVAQMNGVATAMGNGTTSTGTQRVSLSSDSTGQVATLQQESAVSTATWTSATVVGTELRLTGTGYNVATVQFLVTGSITGGRIIVETLPSDLSMENIVACVDQATGASVTEYRPAVRGSSVYRCTFSGANQIRVYLPTGGALTSTGSVKSYLSLTNSGPIVETVSHEEDAAHTSGEPGIMALAVRNDANLALTSTDLDYSPISVDSVGRLKINVDQGTLTTVSNLTAITSEVKPGTAAGDLGKGEDLGHTTGDVGVLALGVRNDGSSTQMTSANTDYGAPAVDGYGAVWARQDHPNHITCTADNIAASLTELTGCGVPTAGLKIWVTDIIAISTTTTAGNMQLRYGTGTNCGTGTTAFYPPVSASRTVLAPASTSATGPLQIHFTTPYGVPVAANALCVIGAATNTTNILVTGFIAP